MKVQWRKHQAKLEIIRAMVEHVKTMIELEELDKDRDGVFLIADLVECRNIIGGWINLIDDTK